MLTCFITYMKEVRHTIKKAETAWCFIISAGINMTEQRSQRRPVETNVLKADQLDPIHLSLGIVL